MKNLVKNLAIAVGFLLSSFIGAILAIAIYATVESEALYRKTEPQIALQSLINTRQDQLLRRLSEITQNRDDINKERMDLLEIVVTRWLASRQ